MRSTLYPLCAVFAWIVVLGNLKALPAMRRQPTRLTTWIMFLFFALIFTTGWSPVYDNLDSWTGLPESSRLIAQCLVVCFSAAALALLQLWTYPPEQAARKVRFTFTAIALVLVVMTALFLRSDGEHHHDNGFRRWYGASVEYDLYLLVYLLVFTATLVGIIRLCARYARLTTRSWLRTGLFTTAVGAGIGMIYSLSRLTDIVVSHLGVDLDSWDALAQAGAGIGALLVMIGLTMHSWGPRMSSFAVSVRRLSAYPRLRPLWAAFYARDHSLAFDDQRPDSTRWDAAKRLLSDVDYHVGRRVVEIRDGILTLHPYLDPHIAHRARAYYQNRQLTGDDLDAAVEAAQIHAALDATATDPHRPAEPPPPDLMNNTPDDLDAEIAWLLKVTNHYKRRSAFAPDLTDQPTLTTGEFS
jgi:hypothetical protein